MFNMYSNMMAFDLDEENDIEKPAPFVRRRFYFGLRFL